MIEDLGDHDPFPAPPHAAHDREGIVKEDILPGILPAGSAFALHYVLSRTECQHYIDWCKEIEMESVDTDYRLCDRVIKDSSALAKELYLRCAPFLNGAYDLTEDKPSERQALVNGVVQEGVPSSKMQPGAWHPSSINERFRLVRYQPGGVFLPHYDYGYIASDTMCSIQTFMLYLDSPDNACTTIYNDAQEHYEEGQESNVLYRLQPQPGTAFVFNPRITHGGDPLHSGSKHILRTEVMYSHESHVP